MLRIWPRRNTSSKRRRLTIIARSVLLLSSLLLFNAVCWILAGILFGRKEQSREVLSLALLAWTYGLRHGLDSDHISAIDNATRGLVALGQQPVTCGLFFSLGHSTIVIAVNVAIAISSDIFYHLDTVGSVGAIVGTAISASFLFLLAVGNSIILYGTIRRRRAIMRAQEDRARRRAAGLAVPIEEEVTEPLQNRTLMLRILGPVMRVVDRPWKMYPVGVLFGFGFDTASSIALLAIAALAKSIAQSDIVILPFLFTAGMTIVDSIDSILMLYSYALPSRHSPEGAFTIFERKSAMMPVANQPPTSTHPHEKDITTSDPPLNLADLKPPLPDVVADAQQVEEEQDQVESTDVSHLVHNKQTTLSGLSIILTLLSILVALSVSLIEIMGLIGDNCGPCQAAENAPDGGGLAGAWWRGWDAANDDSGFIGAAIVGGFLFVVLCWYGLRWVVESVQKRRSEEQRTPLQGP